MKARPKHLVIPDTQVKTGVPTQHLTWVGNYIVEKKPDVIIHLGDHWDLPSLSSYDYGKKCYEGREYVKDIDSGNAGLARLMEPIEAYNRTRRKNKEKLYKPRLVILRGNHEDRQTRVVESDRKLSGLVGDHLFNDVALGWEPIPFLQPIIIDGISYCHYFYQPMSGRPYGGTAHTKLKNIGHSFTMGHQQGLDVATRTLDSGAMHWGMVAGSCYLHDEAYKGPQANGHWRGIVVKHDVKDGAYNPMFVDMDYLRRRYS